MPDHALHHLPDPLWMKIREEEPARQVAIKTQIELLEGELAILRNQLRRSSPTTPAAIFNRHFEASVSGFHNPSKHRGLSVQRFLDLYKFRLAQKGTPYHRSILSWVESNEASGITMIARPFFWNLRRSDPRSDDAEACPIKQFLVYPGGGPSKPEGKRIK